MASEKKTLPIKNKGQGKGVDENTYIVLAAGGAFIGNVVFPGVGGALAGAAMGLFIASKSDKKKQ